MPKDIVLKGELVSFPTKDGLMLHGFLVRPKRRSAKALIHVHGLQGKFYGSSFADALSKEAAEKGINFLSIELRGSYTIVGFRKRKGRKKVWVSAGGGFERFEDSVYDIAAAIRFLRRQGVREIYLEGHSTGCQKITYYQYKKKDRSVKALALSAPADDYNIEKKAFGKDFGGVVARAKVLCKKDRDIPLPKNRIIKNGEFSVGRFLSFADTKFVEARLFNYDSDKLREFGSIRQPVLAIFGSREEHRLKPVREYMRILERDTGSKRFDHLIIKGGDHGFSGHEKETAKAIIKWLGSLAKR
jgi:pimeloyl-ACP methyl ester carboxylesterase